MNTTPHFGLALIFLVASFAGAAQADSATWQQDSYLFTEANTAPCFGDVCAALLSGASTELPADSTQLEVVIADVTTLEAPFRVSFWTRDPGEEPVPAGVFCGAASLEIPEGAEVAFVQFLRMPELQCESPRATTGTILLRADGSWTPHAQPCQVPLDLVYDDPSCGL